MDTDWAFDMEKKRWRRSGSHLEVGQFTVRECQRHMIDPFLLGLFPPLRLDSSSMNVSRLLLLWRNHSWSSCLISAGAFVARWIHGQ